MEKEKLKALRSERNAIRKKLKSDRDDPDVMAGERLELKGRLRELENEIREYTTDEEKIRAARMREKRKENQEKTKGIQEKVKGIQEKTKSGKEAIKEIIRAMALERQQVRGENKKAKKIKTEEKDKSPGSLNENKQDHKGWGIAIFGIGILIIIVAAIYVVGKYKKRAKPVEKVKEPELPDGRWWEENLPWPS